VTDRDLTAEFSERIKQASASRPLRLLGGDSKRFLGRQVDGEPLSVADHRGILNYDPAELVLTARAGTPLAEVERHLANHGQRLPFEPPHFGSGATLGGAVAAGLAGPARAWAGPVKDYLLGVRIISGHGRVLRFGGEVMKNVAGYDVARLMAGALGTLGLLTEVSIRVQPAALAQCTIVIETAQDKALSWLAELASTALPISASCWSASRLYLRLEGAEKTLSDSRERICGEEVPDAEDFWISVKEQRHEFFSSRRPLWRVIVPASAPVLPLTSDPLIEWNGMQRWYAGGDRSVIHSTAAAHDGFATLFRGATADEEVFAPLPIPLMNAHRALKQAFDPRGIFNPGRMYRGL